ncbi:MAG: DUF6705 family protein [Ferruginibacter sp.]
MKKTVFILITFILLFNRVNAQVIIPVAGSYYTNTTMNGFHGTWQWVPGIDTVKIYLHTEKIFFDMNGGFYKDCLIGWHMYKRGTTVVENRYTATNNIDASTFLGSNPNRVTTIVTGTFTDITKNKTGDLVLTLNATGNQMTWKLEDSEGIRVRAAGDAPFANGFTLPENMVLNKQ